ncbi:MAG: DUF3786 domain-containing protein [Candidatus Adiutrix sp.]|jgi:hypothetical protein|nr:DUF3786 domain-containing protein [Candidatus Adiutrix sp.]
MTKAKNAANREQYYRNQITALAETDLSSQAAAMGLTMNADGRVAATFFERPYLISREGVEAQGGWPATSDHKSVIAHYLMSRGSGELSGEYVPIGRLTGMIETGASPSDNLIRPLTEKFGDKYELFAEAAVKIGGCHEGLAPSGGQSWMFRPLPKLPVQIVFFEADDEFPAEVKVLFDASATTFVSYECLELLEIVLVVELFMAGGLIGCDCGGSLPGA